MRIKIVTIVGARPQFIKAAVLSREFQKHSDVKEIIIHTGQHFDNNMSDIFFSQMNIPKPNYNLNINGLNHGAMTGQMLEKIESILIDESPDWVIVYGDTNTTLAGSLAAKKLKIKLIHIESGLRSFNNLMPEEINRIITDRISDVLFCPSSNSIKNLLAEGFDKYQCEIINSGDIMLDASKYYSDKSVKPKIDIGNEFVLCTIHRENNTDDLIKLKEIFSALEEISKSCKVVLPLHPRTKAKLMYINYDFDRSSIKFISPLGYLEMIWMLKNCNLVITDSGGLQKEAYFFNKYCITLREETEWTELISNNVNTLCGSNYEKILSTFRLYIKLGEITNSLMLYGTGNSANIIYNKIIELSN